MIDTAIESAYFAIDTFIDTALMILPAKVYAVANVAILAAIIVFTH